MTQQDYDKHAQEYRQLLRSVSRSGRKAVWRVIRATANLFELDNSSFDRERFINACDPLVK